MPKAKVAICPNVGWFKDFVDPQSMLDPTFNGDEHPARGGNINWPQLNDPKVNAAMDKAAIARRARRARKAWAEIDKMITARRAGRPVGLGQDDADPVEERQRRRATRSCDAWDLTFTSLK